MATPAKPLISLVSRGITGQKSRKALDQVIATWLHAKAQRSRSPETLRAYDRTIHAFRDALVRRGLDLDSAPAQVALVAAAWADQGDVAASTFNQRLAILSSFYGFCERHELIGEERAGPGAIYAGNPIRRVERRPAQGYRDAQAVDDAVIRMRLAEIDRHHLAGKRDWTILALALTTGRRVAEIAGLRRGNLAVQGQAIIATFHCKGGKVMRDQLAAPVAEALVAYLVQLHGHAPSKLPADTPLWVSLARNTTHGQALGPQALAALSRKHLKVNFHALRHTFARAMEDAGAKPSEIQARLGHESLETTGKYLAALRSAANPHSHQLADRFGLS